MQSRDIGKVVRVEDAAGRYIEFCKSTVPEGFSLRGLRIAVDCAHGATYHIAPSVLSELGAEVITMGVQPDGFNINEGVGSTDMAALSELVRQQGADIGIAYDGDGDRVLMTDEKGEIIDGDELVYIIAMYRLATGLSDAGVVGTQMSNLGLELALQEAGLQFVRAQVGDRYVKAQMEANGWLLGGESSGHIICSNVTTTGDGIIAVTAGADGTAGGAGQSGGTARGHHHVSPDHDQCHGGRQSRAGRLSGNNRCGGAGGARLGQEGGFCCAPPAPSPRFG